MKISTGQESNLKTYKSIAHFFGEKAEAFIDAKIAESPDGENEKVLIHETQMLHLLAHIEFSSWKSTNNR